jgi:hypothetical protein
MAIADKPYIKKVQKTNDAMLKRLTQITVALFIALPLQAQNSDSLQPLPSKYLDNVSSKAEQLQQKLDRKSDKALLQMQKLEKKIRNKLAKKDSLKVVAIFGNAEQQYKQLEERLEKGVSLQQYISNIDTISTSLKFLQQNPQFLSNVPSSFGGSRAERREGTEFGGGQKLKDAISKVACMESKFQKTEEIKNFLKQRRQWLREQLGNMGFAREFKKLNKQVYYYNEQINVYKELLKNHKKAERKALELLGKMRLFQKFFQKHSFLASLFRMPGDPDDPSSFGGAGGGLAGLQTRNSVTALIQTQLAAGGPNAQQQFQQNIAQAQSELSALKNKMNQLGAGSSDGEMPEGFRQNPQRKKNFWKKWELDINAQSNRANGVMPVSSDIGISAGFKPNNWFTAGGGFAGRIGWGKDIRHIAFSYSGISVRSFVEIKLKSKGNFNAVAGYEMNYRPEIRNIEQLKDYSAWSRVGLAGISKIVSVKSKFFKKAKLQIMWDFLSYSQIPKVNQPIVFRIGYNF